MSFNAPCNFKNVCYYFFVVGEIQVLLYTNCVEGQGSCPMCGKTVAGRLWTKKGKKSARQMGVNLSDSDITRALAEFLGRKHRDRCTANPILPYDGRFDDLTINPETKKLHFGFDHPISKNPTLARDFLG